jgi:hypothetical protein
MEQVFTLNISSLIGKNEKPISMSFERNSDGKTKVTCEYQKVFVDFLCDVIINSILLSDGEQSFEGEFSNMKDIRITKKRRIKNDL